MTRAARLKTGGLAAALMLAALVPTLDDGGFNDPSRLWFVALAGLLLLVVVEVDLELTLATLRSPLVIVLGAFAVLSVVSTVWTVSSSADAVRDGLVVAGYGIVMVGAAVLVTRCGPYLIAVGIAALAVYEALIGLAAAATHSLPYAERLVRVWRPGGTFEYQPALALLELGVIPIFYFGMRAQRRSVAACSAVGTALAGGALAMTGDRLGFALAAVMVVGWLPFVVSRRVDLGATIALIVAVCVGAAVALLELNAATAKHSPGPGFGALTVIVLCALAVGAAWACARNVVQELPTRQGLMLGLGCAGIAVAALAWRALDGDGSAGISHLRTAGLLHGRSQEWLAALQTWGHYPIVGSGAGSYALSSLPYQSVAVSRFAHDLPLETAAELGVPGLILSLAVYGAAGRTIARTVRDSRAWPLIPISAFFLVSNLVDWTWHLAGLGAIWAAATGALIGISQMSSGSEPPALHGPPRKSGATPG